MVSPKRNGLGCHKASLLFKQAPPLSIGLLHRAVPKRAEDGLILWAFDLMQLDPADLGPCFLPDRKRRLGHLVERARIERLRYSYEGWVTLA